MRWLAPMDPAQAARALRGPEGPVLLGQALHWLHQEHQAGDLTPRDPHWDTPLISLRLIGPASTELFDIPAIEGHEDIKNINLFGLPYSVGRSKRWKRSASPTPVKNLSEWKEALKRQTDQLSGYARRAHFTWPSAWSDSPLQLSCLEEDGAEVDLANLVNSRPRNILSMRRALHAAMIAAPERARAAIRAGPCPGGNLSWAHLLAAEQCSAEWRASQLLGRRWLKEWRAQMHADNLTPGHKPGSGGQAPQKER